MMTKNLEEETWLKYYSTKEDDQCSEETMRTLFVPKTNRYSSNREFEKSAGGIHENDNFTNKESLEIPAVLLFPCSGRSSIVPEQNSDIESGTSIEFLFPTSFSTEPSENSAGAYSFPDRRTQETFSRKPSLFRCRKFLFNRCTSKAENAGCGFSSEISYGNDILDDVQYSKATRKNEKLLAVAKYDCLTSSLLGSSISTGTLSVSETEPKNTREDDSSKNLHRSVSTCCLRRPSIQLCCLLGKSYVELSTSTSECFSRDQSFEGNGHCAEDELRQPDFFCSDNANRWRGGFPVLARTRAVTQSSAPQLKELAALTLSRRNNELKELSAPDLRLNKARKSNYQQDISKAGNSNLNFRGTASSILLHPDEARCSSGSAVSLSSQTSTKSGKRYCHSAAKSPRLRRQQFDLYRNSGSPNFGASSDKSEKSYLKSSLSLIVSPSKLLSKLNSSRHSVWSSADAPSYRRRRENIDYPDDDRLVTLNVSGRRFQIQDYFLSIHPNTLLGGKARSLFYDGAKEEFFFDRDPDCFRYIWDFYQSGQLHCPREECVQLFLDELTFFGLDVSMLCDCCWQETFEVAHERLTKRREEKEAAENEAKEEKFTIRPNSSLRTKIWATVQEPSYSSLAKAFYFLSVFVIGVSVIANTTETIACQGVVRMCQEENEEAYFYIDTVCVGFFTFEYLTRLIFSPNRLRFLIGYMSIVDMLAILPNYVDLVLELFSVEASSGMHALTVLRVLRTLRVFKLLRHSKRLKKLIETVKDSATELGLITFVYLVLVILFSSIIYFAELSDDTQFSSIPQAMWYAVITSTTAG